ncbi:uncharacterized protein LY89DRAFT_781079 [Mollisia scopiformis]|uniref:Uncharacterized protein n=1 Tax=Mollisia scopiformis TaxID=149040 RepID=A0A194XCT3_MOLSC|nr:uncharacterized protein LY89DRAFT_781079 [Mollisia scopiformis]KUJ17961.1 hypothetical protein LY89DRAFT_781079 [Mollisia scopiformis]
MSMEDVRAGGPSGRPSLGNRRQTIPRKPVGIERHDTLSVPSGYTFDVRGHEDGASFVSRLSTQSSGGFYGHGFISTFSPDTGYHGNNIGEQDIPLMDITPATPRHGTSDKDSIPPSRIDPLSDYFEQNPDYLDERPCDWLPAALRWPFMTILLLVSFGLGILVLALTIVSARNSGLGSDQNTSIFLFGWRFTPTLFAVIYTLLLMAMVGEIKRTEPYARLSRPQGSSAASSLFFKPRAFWFDPFDSFSKQKNDRIRNWTLFWASIVYILGLLIVSPFSAALLSPAEVLITQDAQFSRLATSAASPMQLSTDDSVFFRTISSIILNTTTSAWLSNNYTVVPFWPSNLHSVPSGAALSANEEQWVGNTTVFQTSLQCDTMNLKQFSNYSLNSTAQYNASTIVTTNLTSFVLESEDGCSFGLSGLTPEYDGTGVIWSTGGGWWAAAPNFSYPLLWGAGNGSAADFTTETPIAINSSSQCGNRTMFFLATPESVQPYQAKGYICSSGYYSAILPVTVSNTGTSSSFKFDEQQFNRTKTPIPANVLNLTDFENTFLSQNWSTKFQPPDSSTNPVMTIRPGIGGPLILVGAQNGFDIPAMIANPNLVDQGRQVKQRLLGESMQPIFQQIGTQQAEDIQGQIGVNEERIVVSLIIGTLLTVVLFMSTFMIGLVVYFTRLRKRPLNLYQNPTSTAAAASLIRSEPSSRSIFEGLDRSSEDAMLRQLDGYVFSLRDGVLYSYHVKDNFQESKFDTNSVNESSKPEDWRPKVLRGWLLALLLFLLAALVITLAVLYAKFHTSGIHQSFLVSGIDFKIDNRSLEALAPYSIIPTLIAVGIRLWWGSIDETFRRLQPYVSMAHNQSESMKMTVLSYVSAPLVWAAVKAVPYRHWLLVIVAAGAFLSEIFTIGMSALWDRNPGFRTYNSTLARTVEFRSVPAIFEVPPPSPHGYDASVDTQNAKGALTNVFGNLLTSWLYAAINEGAYNTTPSAWMNDDWAFMPAEISSISISSQSVSSSDNAPVAGSAVNATFDTPAIRGRLECSPLDMSNTSAWLYTLDFTNKTAWNSTIPSDLKTGYELKLGLAMNESVGDGKYTYWDDDSPYFSFFATDYRLKCCGNETNGTVNEASVGYWSLPADSMHQGIVVKWITGHPYVSQFNDSTGSDYLSPGEGYGAHLHWAWKDVPKVTALNCTPVFETANASITVDVSTGIVQNYTINDTPRLDPNAWAYNYVQLNVSKGVPYNATMYTGSGYEVKPGSFVNNVTVSYGYLFHDALLGAANSALTGNDPMAASVTAENLSDRTFNFRLPGLNVDFMSYVSLSLANNTASPLLDPNTLGNISSTVFSMFFKHFVHSNVTTNAGMYMNGSWGLQPRGAVIPSDLGPTISSLSKAYLQDNFTASNTPPTITTTISTRIQQLDLSPVAVFLCISILCFLMLTTAIVLGWHRKYLRLLPRDVDTLGSILGFVYASERLLAKSNDKTALETDAGNTEMVRMGWFESRGKRRWGVEIVDRPVGLRKPPKPVKVPKLPKPPRMPKPPRPPKVPSERKRKKDKQKAVERIETGYPMPGMARGDYEEVGSGVDLSAWQLRPARAERWA